MRNLDLPAVLRGAGVGAVLIVPAAILSRVVAGDDTADGTPALVFVFFFVILAGFVLAGWSAGTQPAAERTPVQHGTAAAVLTYVVVQGVGIVFVVASGDSPRFGSIVANLLLAATCGAVGGLVATRAINRRLEGDPT